MESNEYITIDIEIKYTNQKNYGDIQIEGNQEKVHLLKDN